MTPEDPFPTRPPRPGPADSQPARPASQEVPSPVVDRYPWLRPVTHLVALGWATAELGWWGARPLSLMFVGVILSGTEGTRLVGALNRVLRAP